MRDQLEVHIEYLHINLPMTNYAKIYRTMMGFNVDFIIIPKGNGTFDVKWESGNPELDQKITKKLNNLEL